MSGKIGQYITPAGRRRFESAYDEGMRTLPASAGVHDVDTDFGRVRVYRFGDAPGAPILLLHAGGDDGRVAAEHSRACRAASCVFDRPARRGRAQ